MDDSLSNRPDVARPEAFRVAFHDHDRSDIILFLLRATHCLWAELRDQTAMVLEVDFSDATAISSTLNFAVLDTASSGTRSE